jgi:hypothetical protein
MIRRILWYGDRGMVKWALIAAAFGLSIGHLAERTVARRAAEAAPAVAEQPVEVQSPRAARGAS